MSAKIIDKNYGSIPHLSTSKMYQQSDKRAELGQELILTKKARDWKDLIIVTEKIDGSNMGVIKKNGRLIVLVRSGYDANTSQFESQRLFYKFIYKNESMFSWLPEGWRVVGEWCLQAHGTIYDISDESPFIAFDIINPDNKRILYIDFIKTCSKFSIPMVPLLHIGQPISIGDAIVLMGKGHYGKPDRPEGVVYRVERDGRVEFLAKWVRSDKEDGKYLGSTIWNIGSEKWVA